MQIAHEATRLPTSVSNVFIAVNITEICKWGWTNAVLVDEQGVLIAGHARVGAAARLGLKSIPVIVARGWSDEEKQGYRLATRAV